MSSAEDILSFWFSPKDASGLVADEQVARWWQKNPTFDRDLAARFEVDYDAIVAAERGAWLNAPQSLLAYVLVLDQFARNMFRGTPRMFAADAQALAAAKKGLEDGSDDALTVEERMFLYLPFMHSEALADQQRCVALFSELRDSQSGALRARLDNNVSFAERHRNIVARFGRFPHRNEILGRESSADELAFLEEPGSGF